MKWICNCPDNSKNAEILRAQTNKEIARIDTETQILIYQQNNADRTAADYAEQRAANFEKLMQHNHQRKKHIEFLFGLLHFDRVNVCSCNPIEKAVMFKAPPAPQIFEPKPIIEPPTNP